MKGISDFLKLSLNNLKRKKFRSVLTMIGIFIGIAAVVSLISLGDGLKTAITGQFGSLSTDKLLVQAAGTGFGPPGSTAVTKLTDHDVQIIKRVSGAEEVITRLIRIGRIEFNNNVQYFYLGSLPESKEGERVVYETANLKLANGRLIEAGESGKVVIGSEVAKQTAFEKEIRTGNTINIQGKDFKVVGVLEPASTFTINSAIIIGEKDMKELLGIGDEVDLIVVQVDPSQAEEVAQNIEKELRRDRGQKIGEEDFSVQTPLQAISSVNTILDIINLIVTGIAAISLIVGGIGIANTMYTSVLERRKDIGTMKAVGAKNSDILWVFVIESAFIGFLGGTIGALAGIGLAFSAAGAANAAFGSTIITVKLSLPLAAGAVAFATGVGIISGLLPAIQASRMKPVDALRG